MSVFKKYSFLVGICMALSLQAQQSADFRITVKSAQGEAVEGAMVRINGSSRSLFTDVNGEVKLPQEQLAWPLTVYISHLAYQLLVDTLQYPPSSEKVYYLEQRVYFSEAFVVAATRYASSAPATYYNVQRSTLQAINLGQDLPLLLQWTPAVVSTSDAGAGVGYTAMRIRGSDQTRINVTMNGIPINDAESQGVFWVNMPDLTSSLSSIQIQRGLGSSTNGAGAFGASVNMESTLFSDSAATLLTTSYGSFATQKHSASFSTGKLKSGLAFSGRLSAIRSDGYIDRASSDLKSYFLSAGYQNDRWLIKAIHFAGAERTYQSWYGTPESRLRNDLDGMLRHAANEGYNEAQLQNLLQSGRTFNFYLYENQIDNYKQDHYQLHLLRSIGSRWQLALAGHYTYGRGFFEEFKYQDALSNYGLPPVLRGSDTLYSSDIIRRRWLVNDFYGGTYSLSYHAGVHRLLLGGGIHLYRGDHFGELVWARVADQVSHLQRYYEGTGTKDDINSYIKWEASAGRWEFMADAQLRSVVYQAGGIENDLQPVSVDAHYLFFNPKAGATYTISEHKSLYAYVGIGHREPVRSDFVDATAGEEPRRERLINAEAGYRYSNTSLQVQANAYLMYYRDQLVLTGELNDVGAALRRNVPRSYRAGVEVQGSWQPLKKMEWRANLALSQNKILRFTEIIYDYSGAEIVQLSNTYSNTDISFSPSLVAGSFLTFQPFANSSLALISKYVSRQYLDNTANASRSIAPYFVNDLRLGYQLAHSPFELLELSLLVNNVFDVAYESNGYTYSYRYNSLITENFYYPQAGINFLVGLRLGF